MLAVVLLAAKAGARSPMLLVAETGAQCCSHKVGMLPKGYCHGSPLHQKQNPKEGREG